MQSDKVWKAVSVYKFIFPVVTFFFSFEFSAEINYFEATDNVRWSASEEKFNVFTDSQH